MHSCGIVFQTCSTRVHGLLALLLALVSVANAHAQTVVYDKRGETVTENSDGSYTVQYTLGSDSLFTGYFVPGNRVIPNVEAQVVFDRTRSLYVYRYVVGNTVEARYKLSEFGLQSNAEVVKTIQPDKRWTFWSHKRRELLFWSYTGAFMEDTGIAAGSTVEAFILWSPYLPAIISGYASNTDSEFFPDLDEGINTLGELAEFIYTLKDSMALVSFETLGPGIPPLPFDPTRILERLQESVKMAVKLGWISDRVLGDHIDQQLAASRGFLQSGDQQQAMHMLQRLQTELDNEKRDGQRISRAAQYVLSLNINYLVEHLFDPPR